MAIFSAIIISGLSVCMLHKYKLYQNSYDWRKSILSAQLFLTGKYYFGGEINLSICFREIKIHLKWQKKGGKKTWNCDDGIFDFYDVFGVANIRSKGLRKKKIEVLITRISYLLLLKDKKKTLKIIF